MRTGAALSCPSIRRRGWGSQEPARLGQLTRDPEDFPSLAQGLERLDASGSCRMLFSPHVRRPPNRSDRERAAVGASGGSMLRLTLPLVFCVASMFSGTAQA